MKWILARMLELEPDTISVTTELEGPPERPHTVYFVQSESGTRRVTLSDVLEYIEKHLKDDPILDRLPRR